MAKLYRRKVRKSRTVAAEEGEGAAFKQRNV